MVAVLSGKNEFMSATSPNAAALWLTERETQAATGWTLKPEGFCKDEVCVPLSATDRERHIRDAQDGDRQINVSALWTLMGKPVAASANGDAWSLGEDAGGRNDQLLSLEAPDFTLPDLSGTLHSLSDFRRQRVLLITWASW